jgi:hypothetical protein
MIMINVSALQHIMGYFVNHIHVMASILEIARGVLSMVSVLEETHALVEKVIGESFVIHGHVLITQFTMLESAIKRGNVWNLIYACATLYYTLVLHVTSPSSLHSLFSFCLYLLASYYSLSNCV